MISDPGPALPSKIFSKLSNEDLRTCAVNICDELWKRFDNKNLEKNCKDEIFSIFLTLKSKLSLVETQLLGKSAEPKNYTPMRGNHLKMALLLKNYNNLMDEEKNFLNKFVTGFWSSCECKYQCFSRVRLADVLSLYDQYSKLKEPVKSHQVGAILQNLLVTSEDPRNTGKRVSYKYRVGDVEICYDFFSFIFDVTTKQIQRLQARIKNGESFDTKKRGNNVVSFDR